MNSKTKPLIGLICRLSEDDDWYYLPVDYSRAIAAAGGIPVLIPLLAEDASELTSRLDAVVLCGSGSDVDPARYFQGRHPAVKTIHRDLDETCFRVLDQAFLEKKPVFGVCFGMQMLNVFLEGTLIQHIPECVPGAIEHQDRRTLHPVAIEPGSQLAEWAGESRQIVVNSTHHQSIQELGRDLRVAARAPDGVIEAVEADISDHFVVGVQWHPERIQKEEKVSRRLFSELVLAAAARREELLDGARAKVGSPAV